MEAEDEMPKFKIQMTNNGIRNTDTENGGRTTSTDTQMEVKTSSILREASLSPYEELHVKKHGNDHRHGDQ
jgi:hypothetical protein